MPDIVQNMRFRVDVKTGLVKQPQRESLMKDDKKANRIVVELMDGKEPYDITGVEVTGRFYRPPNGREIELNGTVQGNEAAVELTDECYTANGYYEATVSLKIDGVERTVLFISGDVLRSGNAAAATEEGDAGSGGSTTTGSGLPGGGTTGQVLVKVSSAAGAAIWKTLTAADIGAQPAGDYAKQSDFTALKNKVDNLPTGGGTTLPKLEGTTATVTPEQVYEAITTGQGVAIAHAIEGVGAATFKKFDIVNIGGAMQAVVASTLVSMNGAITALMLMGVLGMGWMVDVQNVPAGNIPTTLPNPHALVINDWAGKNVVTYDGGNQYVINLTTEKLKNDWGNQVINGHNAIDAALREAGANKSAFLFYTDAHWDNSGKNSPMIIRYIQENTALNKTFFGGDIIGDAKTSLNALIYLDDWQKRRKMITNHHSVAGNHDSSGGFFDEKGVYELLMAPEETADIVRESEGLYYYLDWGAERTRYLFLDTGLRGYNALDGAQRAFVSAALKSTPDKWHIVAIAHKWLDTNYDVNPPVPAGMSAAGAALLSMFDSYNLREGEYANCGGWVEFVIGGHTHWDWDTASERGIPVLLMETDSNHVRSGLSNGSESAKGSVSAVIADYGAKVIKVIRMGRGSGRTVALTWRGGYTNVLTAAGWQTNKRVSISGGYTEVAQDGVMLTGYIKVRSGDVIRLKNVTMPPDASGYKSMVYGYTDSKAGFVNMRITPDVGESFYVVVENGNVVQFTVSHHMMDETGSGYIRINAEAFTGDSIITVNEVI